MKEMCDLARVKKLRTSVYHPQTNGQVERFNRTLIDMLRKLPSGQRQSWDEHLDRLVAAYNSTRNAVTGYSPFFLFFGRRPRLAVDLHFPKNPADKTGKGKTQFVTELQEQLQWAHRLAATQAEKSMLKQKRYYDKNVRAVNLEPGDLVLVKSFTRGRKKLIPIWEETPYKVLEKPYPDIPVYRVENTATRAEKRFHRNNLFPLLMEKAEEPDTELPVKAFMQMQTENEIATERESETETAQSESAAEESLLTRMTRGALSMLQLRTRKS